MAPRWLAAAGLAALLACLPGTAGARPRVCLVLSGGGARGIAHIGVLAVLEELRVPVDCIVGTSAGAIIGGAYASGASPAEIEHAIRGADWDYLLSDQPARFERSVYGKEVERLGIGGEVGLKAGTLALPRGVVIGQHLQFYLQSLVAPAGDGAFDDLPIRYRALATDFESGGLVVLDHGDLAAAIRASMSVPGAFAPVELDGRLLVDGGLVRNLGVDVARSLGADIVIAVNVGTPLLKRAELGSLLGVAEQTLGILTEQNVRTSVAGLTARDVLITPALGGFSSGDFAHGADHIPAGAAAARAVASQLAALSVDAAEYQAWQAQHRRPRVPAHYDHLEIDTASLKRVPPAAITALVGATPDPRRPEDTISALLGTDDFERVEGEVRPGPAGTTLVLRPVEKPWGPDYLRGGLRLAAGADGRSAFTLWLDQRSTWLDGRGLEWRNRASLGQVDSLSSALRVPLDATRLTFLAPYVSADDTLRDLYVGSDSLETYRLREAHVGVDIGRRLGNLGEVSVGFAGGSLGAARTVGAAVEPDEHLRLGELHANVVLDGLDNLEFPRHGFLLRSTLELQRRLFGGEAQYDRLTLEGQQAFGGENSSWLLSARLQSSLGTTLPYYADFALGGFLNLSGYLPDQLVAERVTLARGIYRHRLAAFSPLLPAVYGGVSLELADLGARPGTPHATQRHAASAFLSGDSALGPLYLGVGVGEGGFVSIYLLVGRPP